VIHLSVIADAEETILNKCHEGAFLVCVLFSKKQLQNDSKAREESIIYAIPIAVLDRL
jgi:CBS domain-containing protein